MLFSPTPRNPEFVWSNQNANEAREKLDTLASITHPCDENDRKGVADRRLRPRIRSFDTSYPYRLDEQATAYLGESEPTSWRKVISRSWVRAKWVAT